MSKEAAIHLAGQATGEGQKCVGCGELLAPVSDKPWPANTLVVERATKKEGLDQTVTWEGLGFGCTSTAPRRGTGAPGTRTQIRKEDQ